jgi:hypothetical protein
LERDRVKNVQKFLAAEKFGVKSLKMRNLNEATGCGEG